MFRFLILLLIIALVVLLIRKLLTSSSHSGQTKPSKTTGNMVRCSYCGLHVPESEAILLEGKHYCSEEHKRLDHS